MTELVIRDLDNMDEFRSAEKLQYAVWGADEVVVPGDLMMVIQKEGGIAAGAFLNTELIGYVFGFPTKNQSIQHSHLLAVHEMHRGSGLGRQLKWYQRDWCLTRGITHIRWTFDPLRSINASLNLNRLGAICTTYHEDFYGEMKGLNAGAPSDRIVADWFLEADRVRARADGNIPVPDFTSAFPIEIPADFGSLLTNDPDLALSERLRVRNEMRKAFENNYFLSNFDIKSMRYELKLTVLSTK